MCKQNTLLQVHAHLALPLKRHVCLTMANEQAPGHSHTYSLCGDSGIVVADMAYHLRHAIPCVLDAAKVIIMLQAACGL